MDGSSVEIRLARSHLLFKLSAEYMEVCYTVLLL